MMLDDNYSSFRRNGVKYILIKGIDLFKDPYYMDIICIIKVPRVHKRGYTVNNWVQPLII